MPYDAGEGEVGRLKRNIGEAAALTGVSIRTLRYYDEIGLLKPCEVTAAGYRLYDEAALQTLQQILFYRELEFPLSDVQRILSSPDYDRREALVRQRALLQLKRERLDALIRLADQNIGGTENMSVQEFDKTAIEQAKEQYAAEAEQRWGKTEAYKESAARTKGYNKDDWARIQADADEIIKAFAAARDLPADGEQARALVERWQKHITANYYDCKLEILKGLGQMYVADERFTANLDRFGDGTAQFMSEAIAAY